ncbi:MAG: fibronectin type III domain-containing protein, partial [Candidatus Aenigmatarchaeota archaeon]
EIEAIKKYTKEGHGLIATAGTLWYYIPNNNKLAPLFGMRDDLSYKAGYFEYVDVINDTHPIFKNIPQSYYPNYPVSCVPSDYTWNESDLIRGTFISLSNNNVSAIIVNKYKNVSYITHMPEYYSKEYDIQLLYNALTWSNYSSEQHDLEVEGIKINKPYIRPNENFTLEAKISNYGIENETNISVMFLVNGTNVENKTINLSSMESIQVYFNYSNSSTGVFNLSIYVVGNESETFLENNILSKFLTITNADVILVDDDKFSSYESYYKQALEDNGIDYVLWDTTELGIPTNFTLLDFNITIWFTGNDWITTLTSNEIASIKDFLDNGGNLFISGQDIGYDIYSLEFYKNYLHSKYVRDDTDILKIEGMEEDEIGNGLIFDIHGGDGANNQFWPDEIEPYDEFANPSFKYFQNGYAGIRAQTLKYNLIYLAFGFEGINNSQDRKEIMNRSINFFYKYLYDKPPVTFLECPNYTYYTNSQSVWLNLTAIDDFKLVNASLYGNFSGTWQKNETIFISNNTENGTALSLAEGVYIWNYLVYDNSSFYDWGNKNCTLIVDRTLPIISSVSATPSYTYAIISWQTNEPTNSTLYYGTSSTNLNYQLNSTSFSTSHIFTIYGLNSNTKYYYKVSSCDKAGNCNTSQTYEFTTLYQAYCGNGICDSGETYSNCPQDCPSSGGSSGGGIIEFSGASFGLYLFLEPEEINISRGETKTVKARVVNPQNTTLNNITLLIESNCCNITFSPSYINKLKFAETKEFTLTLKPFENASGEYYVKVRAYSLELAFAYKYLKVRVLGAVQNITQNITENVTQNITQNITENATDELRMNAENVINLAERKIREIKQMNLDVSDAEELLEMAKTAFENGDYNNAIRLANQAYSLALSKTEERKEEGKRIDIKVYVGIGVSIGSGCLILAYLKFMRKPKVDEWEVLRKKWKKST